MRGPATATLLAVSLSALIGCSATPPPASPDRLATRLPSAVEADQGNLAKNWKNVEAACLTEERRLRDGAHSSASRRKTAEALLAAGAGSLALATAVYAGLSDPPNGFVIVPLAGGAAAAAAPLTVLLLQDDAPSATDERLRRIGDRRESVRDAYHALLRADRELRASEGAEAGDDHGGLGKRLGEVQSAIEAASKHVASAGRRAGDGPVAAEASPYRGPKIDAKPQTDPALSAPVRAELDDARAQADKAAIGLEATRHAMAERAGRRVPAAKQRRLEAEHALDEALLRLSDVCGGR